MVERNKQPASIEGEQVLITGQKILPAGTPKILRQINMIVYGIDVKKRGNAIIEKKCKDKRPCVSKDSMLDEGDSVSGKILYGLMTYPIGLKDIKIGGMGRTGAHPGQELRVDAGCFVQIVSGWRGSPISIHPKKTLFP